METTRDILIPDVSHIFKKKGEGVEYKINFINNSYRRFAADHKDELIGAFWDCVERGALILREEVWEFEKNLANYTGTKYALGVGSGTDALELACEALGIGPGDEVITVAHTFVASMSCIVRCGATPILVDVGPNELMDVSQLEAAITPRTKAILPVHFHGKVCDMDVIMALAKKYNLYVIEDACQALGSSYKGKMAGSFGDFGCFSFNTPKLMGSWGDGGGIVTNNFELADKIEKLRNLWNMAQTSVRAGDFKTPEVVRWATRSRLDNIQAALLNVKWKYYPQMLNRRKEIANKYCAGLKELPLKLPEYTNDDVIQEFIIRIGDSEERQRFKEHMDTKGVELLIRETTPNHKVRLLGLDHYSLPVTENISKDAVRLPCYPELTDQEVAYIVQSIKEFYDRK